MVPPTTINWKSFTDSATQPYVSAIAPPAELALLAGLAHLVRGAAFTPYASQGLTPDPLQAPAGYDWQMGQVIGPGVYAARAAVEVATDGRAAYAPANVSLYGQESGATAADEVVIPPPISVGRHSYPPPAGDTKMIRAEPTVDASPSSAMNRLFEIVPRLTSHVQRFNGSQFVAFTVSVLQKNDISSI